MPADFMPCEAPIIETLQTRMRGHQISDFADCAAMWADDNVVRYIGGVPATKQDSWARLIRYIGHWHALGYGYWAIEDRQSGAFLGEAGFADFKRDIDGWVDGTPEMGWVLATHSHGRGIASEVVAAALNWADGNLNAAKTTCIIAPDHGASIRVAVKGGFVQTRESTYHGDPTLVFERDRKMGET